MLPVASIFGNLITENDLCRLRSVIGNAYDLHPLLYILSDNEINDSDYYHASTQTNTIQAIKEITNANNSFLVRNKKRILSKDRSESSGVLGEIRCFGLLLTLFGKDKVESVKRSINKTNDFKVVCDGTEIMIEVNTPQMGDAVFQAMSKKKPENQNRNRIDISEFAYNPFGNKHNSGTLPSTIYKLSDIKKDAEQFSTSISSVLWVDLQDDNVNYIANRLEINGPVYIDETSDSFYSNEIWYSLYAEENDPIFTGEKKAPCEDVAKELKRMLFAGRFFNSNSAKFAAVVFYGPKTIALYENTNAAKPLHQGFVKKLSDDSRFNHTASRTNDDSINIIEKIKKDKLLLESLSKGIFSSF